MSRIGFAHNTLAMMSLSLYLISSTATAQTCYSDLIAFGDSMTDTGNITSATLLPSLPYAPGRFSDGPIWLEGLAGDLGLMAINSVSGGGNYAWGGARTGPVSAGFPPSLLNQLGFYLNDTSGVADPAALYVVWGGMNDVRDNDSASAVSNIASIISDLATAGATNFLVPNLPNMGMTPESLAGGAPGGNAALMTTLTLAHNAALAAELSALSATLTGATVIEFDVFMLVNQILTNPGGFGISNVTEPCWTGDLSGTGGVLCADPASYLYWDGIHPTTAAHTLIGNEASILLVDTDGDCDPDVTDPDDDNDGIGDALDIEPLIASNECTSSDGINATLGIAVVANLTCAAQVSIEVQSATRVLGPPAHLLLIAPIIRFLPGFKVKQGGQLTVISADPCPGCSP